MEIDLVITEANTSLLIYIYLVLVIKKNMISVLLFYLRTIGAVDDAVPFVQQRGLTLLVIFPCELFFMGC